jgi:hypothetical protein
MVNFVHTAWLGSKVGVFVDGGYCGPIKVAYDVTAKRSIPFSDIEKDLRYSIIAEYGVTHKELEENGGDVLKWATYPGDGQSRRSMLLFRERHLIKR